LHRIVIGDEKWIFYDNPKKKKYYAKPGQSLPSTSTLTPRPNIHSSCSVWWDQKGLVYYELLKPGDSITGIGYNWFIWAAHCEKNGRNTSKHDKVILLHDNARSHIAKVVKNIWKRSNGMFYRHILRTLLLITDCSEGCSTIWQVTGSLLSQKIGSKIGSLPKTSHFFEMEFENCLRAGKK